MKQVLQSLRSGEITVEEVPEPALRPGGVLVRTAYSLISAGTERSKVDLGKKGLIAKARSRPDRARQVVEKARRDGLVETYKAVRDRLDEPVPLGYSSAGTVLEVGAEVDGVRPGDRVACGGGGYANHAEVVFVPKNLCVPVPSEVDLADAAYTTLGAVAMQGFRQSGAGLGDGVAVIGLGLVGLLALQIARGAGCQVLALDIDPKKTALAEQLGAEAVGVMKDGRVAETSAALTRGLGCDAVLVTAGTESNEPVELAGEIAGDRATVVIVGDVGMKIPRRVYYEKELVLKLSRSYGPGRYDPSYEEHGIDYPAGYVRWTERRNMEEFLRLLAAARVQVGPLTTHSFKVDDAPKAYEVISGAAGGPSLGIHLEYPETPGREGPIVVRERKAPLGAGGLGIGLVGAGSFATRVLLPALKGDSRVVLKGVATAGGLSARHAAERYGFDYAASDAQALLDDEEVSAVVIATRHDSHAPLAAAALAAGKTVFVEKPLALDRAGLDGVVDKWRSAPGELMVGFNRRFAPASTKVKRELAGQAVPPVLVCRVNAGPLPRGHWLLDRSVGGGRILGEACHFVDLLAYLVGDHPRRVFSYSLREHKSARAAESVVVVFDYPNGAVGTLVYAAGGDAALAKERIEAFAGGRSWVIDDFRVFTAYRGGKAKTEKSAQDKGHAAQTRAFVDLALGRPNDITSFPEAVRSTLATFSIIESMVTGKPVDVVYPEFQVG